MILRVPPENLWPTGKTPPELADVFHANGAMTPEESNALRAQQEQGVANYVPPPRPTINRAELEAERQSLQLVESVSPPIDPRGSPPIVNVQRYLVPLSSTVSAEIIIHGHASARDFKLLQKYVRLMSSVEPVELTYKSIPAPEIVKKPRKTYAASA